MSTDITLKIDRDPEREWLIQFLYEAEVKGKPYWVADRIEEDDLTFKVLLELNRAAKEAFSRVGLDVGCIKVL